MSKFVETECSLRLIIPIFIINNKAMKAILNILWNGNKIIGLKLNASKM